MNKSIIAGSIGLGLLALAGSAKALTFNEAAGSNFQHTLWVTPVTSNALLFSVSGLGAQFDSLSFVFVGGPSVTGTTAGGLRSAVFNDIRNNSYLLTGGAAYQVTISGHALSGIPGGHGTLTVETLNGVIAAIPEPESYAMLLAGLGLIGVITRRRKQASS